MTSRHVRVLLASVRVTRQIAHFVYFISIIVLIKSRYFSDDTALLHLCEVPGFYCECTSVYVEQYCFTHHIPSLKMA